MDEKVIEKRLRQRMQIHNEALVLHARDPDGYKRYTEQALSKLQNISDPASSNAVPDPRPAILVETDTSVSKLTAVVPAPGDRSKKSRFARKLESVSEAWDEFQSSRKRDAVYGFLTAVLVFVQRYTNVKRTKLLKRKLRRLNDRGGDPRADVFTMVITAIADDDVDRRAVSKWSRALQYVAKVKPREVQTKKFIVSLGGINACAALYAKWFNQGSGRRSSARQTC